MSTQVLPLDTRVPITDASGMPTPQFVQYWQQLIAQANGASGALMPVPAPVTIYRDYTGAPLAGELPRIFAVKRYLNGTDVSARTRWFLTVRSGTVAASIDQVGVITITSAGAGGVLTLKSVRDNVTLQCDFTVSNQTGSPPTTGTAGGTSNSVSTFTGISSATMAAITSEISIVVGSTGVANLQATLSSLTARAGPEGAYPVFGIWRWYNGTSYVDVGTQTQSSPDCDITADYLDYLAYKSTRIGTVYYMSPGTLNVTATKTGLAAGSTAKFQFYARNDVGTPTRAMTFTGTATATGA